MRSPWLSLCILVSAFTLPARESKPDEPNKVPAPPADSMGGEKAGQVRDDNGLKMKLVWCPPGKFTSREDGHRDEVHVVLTRGFWLGKYEVTQSEWKQVMATDPWNDKDRRKEEFDDFTIEGDDFPATYVSWDNAIEFCRKLTDRERKADRVPEGWEYSLPTEAQWEYACRAGTKTTFNFGDDESKLGDYAWFFDNAAAADEYYAHEVGRKKSNGWGLYDMHGNISEWCRDFYDHRFRGGNDPEETKRRGQYGCRVVRGGNWHNDAENCSSSYHWGERPWTGGDSTLGFRLALSRIPPGKPANTGAKNPGIDK